MDDKKKVIGVSIIAGLLCIGVVTGVSVASAVSPNVKETMTLTEKEYKSNGTFSVEDLKWSEDVSKYNPRFADGLASITYKADGEYAETVVLDIEGTNKKYDILVKVEGVVEPTTTVTTTAVPTTTAKPTVTTTAVPTTAKSTVKTTAKKTTAKTTAKKTTSTTKKKVVSTTKAVENVPICSPEEWEEIDRQHPNHPDNWDPSEYEGW
ncbi:MAG: hypothetical protein II366_00695 [Clostridia bacterium]|nr:hypothetical protein [Clostridia bacterium]